MRSNTLYSYDISQFLGADSFGVLLNTANQKYNEAIWRRYADWGMPTDDTEWVQGMKETPILVRASILGPDGNRMSKSKGNVVSPDKYVNEYGSDVFRLYLMFGFSYTEGGPWNDDGIKAIAKFADRVERIVRKAIEFKAEPKKTYEMGKAEKELNYAKHYALKNITRDVEAFSFNTSVARLMEYVNAMQKYETEVEDKNVPFYKACAEDLVRMIAPFAPHFAEELWEACGHKSSVFEETYPLVDESALIKDEVEYAVQVNSKIKAKMMVSQSLSDEEIQAFVSASAEIAPLLEGKTVRKCIIVKGRLVNLIVG